MRYNNLMINEKRLQAISEWQAKNHEKVLEYKKKYREKNKIKLAAKRKEYVQRKPEVVKNWKLKNSRKISAYERKRRQDPKVIPKIRYHRYRNSAKKRGHEFTLSFEEFFNLIFAEGVTCYYCSSSEQIGIDRDVNSVGYILDNCRSCCWSCNRLKARMIDGKQYIRLCTSVAKNSTI